MENQVKSLTEREYEMFAGLIMERSGVNLGPSKQMLLASRLLKRITQLGIRSFEDYYKIVSAEDESGLEYRHMISLVTTHKTDFFREPKHFDFLREKVFPVILKKMSETNTDTIKIWSAGCSTGEEPYTIAMVLADFIESYPHLDFMILASDISDLSLEKAKSGLYALEELSPVPENYLKKYFLKGVGENAGMAKVCKALRDRIFFRWMNLNEPTLRLGEKFHLIFCRNVIIYFTRDTQTKLICKYCEHMPNGGFLFLGHSETLHSVNKCYKFVQPTIYMKDWDNEENPECNRASARRSYSR